MDPALVAIGTAALGFISALAIERVQGRRERQRRFDDRIRELSLRLLTITGRWIEVAQATMNREEGYANHSYYGHENERREARAIANELVLIAPRLGEEAESLRVHADQFLDAACPNGTESFEMALYECNWSPRHHRKFLVAVRRELGVSDESSGVRERVRHQARQVRRQIRFRRVHVRWIAALIKRDHRTLADLADRHTKASYLREERVALRERTYINFGLAAR